MRVLGESPKWPAYSVVALARQAGREATDKTTQIRPFVWARGARGGLGRGA